MAPDEEWFPEGYSPEISTEEWLALLDDKDVCKEESPILLKCLKDSSGAASCKQLSLKYGRHAQFYNLAGSRLAKRVALKTGCPVIEYENGKSVWWPVLFFARQTDSRTAGNFSWKLRPELAEALDQYDLSAVPLYEGEESSVKRPAHEKLPFQLRFPSEFPKNRIIFGAPGTGKSHKLKQDSGPYFGPNIERVTFHPDYAYSHFMGCYKPQTTPEGNIRYGFVPGPFLRVLVRALRSGMEGNAQPHLLLIEEINRARVAAVFGDAFQLLDREDDEYSEYDIAVSEDVKEYLAGELDCAPEECERIRIPGNMFIWATMNSADQGVFPMDTAFKRRWSFEYLPIDPPNPPDVLLPMNIRGNNVTLSWNKLRGAINDSLSAMRINEDKLIGPYFLKPSVLEVGENGIIKNIEGFNEVFKNKILMYLFEDAARQRRPELFKGCAECHRYSSLCREFDKNGLSIFGDEVINKVLNE
ncbi:MAG: AAA domain-containing protein [Desulfovibrio sp.]|nr:AAA domain-containing protein [Desulfovibrio sp.]